ncbi:hypothetical protein [Streptomyces kunmingensis]
MGAASPPQGKKARMPGMLSGGVARGGVHRIGRRATARCYTAAELP